MSTLVDDFTDTVGVAAGAAWSRYRRYTNREDVEQALWLWLISHEDVARGLEPGKLRWRLKGVADRFCRQQKAQQSGYEPVDEYFYSERQLVRLIFDAFDPEATPPSDSYRADETYAEWATEVADIRRVLRMRSFPLHHYGILRQFVEGTVAEYGGPVQRAVWALQRKLGGTRPK